MCTSMSAEPAVSAVTTRRRVATAVVAAAAVSGLALTAVPAVADTITPPIHIGRALTSQLDRGVFSVPVWADEAADPVDTVTAVIRAGGTPVGDPIPLVRAGTSGADADTWTLPAGAPLKLAEDGGRMPHLGAYTIDITATDALHSELDRAAAGTLDFTLRPEFSNGGVVGFSPATIDGLHRDLTVSATLVGVQPGSGDQVPLAGRDVLVDETPSGGGPGVTATLHATTDAQGRFAVTTTLDASQTFGPHFTESSDEVSGTAAAYGVPNVTQASATITGVADHARVLPGKTFQVSGYVRAGASAPSSAPGLAGVHVAVTHLQCYGPGGGDPMHVTRGVTDATGHYRVTVVADPECSGDWSAYIDEQLLRSETYPSGHVAFPDVSTFAGVSSAIAADGTVTVTGRLLRTYHRNTPYAGQNTFLWYSHDGRTGWIRLKGADTASDGSFKLVHFGYVDGFYQVRHTDTDQLAASNGPIVRLNRIDTRVVGVKASATRVRKNAVITVSGTLQSWTTGAWRAYGRQHVELFFQPRGKTTWQYKGSGTTAANGSVGFRPRVTGDGKWLIQYFGDAKHFDSGATAVYVDMI